MRKESPHSHTRNLISNTLSTIKGIGKFYQEDTSTFRDKVMAVTGVGYQVLGLVGEVPISIVHDVTAKDSKTRKHISQVSQDVKDIASGGQEVLALIYGALAFSIGTPIKVLSDASR